MLPTPARRRSGAQPRGATTRRPWATARNDATSRWSACACETRIASRSASSSRRGRGTRRRRCRTRPRSTGSVSNRTPPSSISTVAWPRYASRPADTLRRGRDVPGEDARLLGVDLLLVQHAGRAEPSELLEAVEPALGRRLRPLAVALARRQLLAGRRGERGRLPHHRLRARARAASRRRLARVQAVAPARGDPQAAGARAL